MIAIIDYGIGNLSSIRNMLKKAGFPDVLITQDKVVIAEADKLILPGVGHFDYGMKQLREAAFFDTLNRKVLEDKIPVLGICLGAQLLSHGSEEGKEPGLGWINAYTRKFDPARIPETFKVPHMGWGDVDIQKDSKLFAAMPTDSRFYFVHTYHLVCEDPADELVSCTYGYPFTAGVEKENILGVQFHPEKSHKYGLRFLTNFVQNY
ncbi:imidazole glycerol phosphate synthase subunit HisH [Haliscomenobacter sp.]|uniref:imidazole glycerol phosphate synthase subunit HisH n=1 Tax=Haliscomenobacter sp. TaxID=2717303 RepID=UPI003BA9CC49